ncbi:MAG: hypothetical protein JNK04_14550 [Myxococcales bacterium]|nr:hypothetical protein [Myxococcales bacterium]
MNRDQFATNLVRLERRPVIIDVDLRSNVEAANTIAPSKASVLRQVAPKRLSANHAQEADPVTDPATRPPLRRVVRKESDAGDDGDAIIGLVPQPPGTPVRDVPVDWEALEDAFENNAPEVHSYLHLVTGDVLRIVDGVADPQMHARIAADSNYLRIDPVSSREQYRWMERYIPMVEDGELQAKLTQAIDGKGAFRRFKDVLMAYGPERERWFSFRSERLRIFMEAWLSAHALAPVTRPVWTPEQAPPLEEGAAAAAPVAEPRPDRRGRNAESLRKSLSEIADSLGPRDLDTLVAFAEFVRSRRAARSFSHHFGETPQSDDDAPSSQEIAASSSNEDE